MNDDEVLNAVKQTLSDVQMDRPVEAIEERGRARRRNRNLFGAVAGGGLAAVAALAVAFSGGQSGTTPATNQPLAEGGATTTTAPAMETVGFTLATQADGAVKVSLDPAKLLNPAGLEKALAAAGVPAVVKKGELCEPKGAELPETDEVFSVKQVVTGGNSRYDLIIDAAAMPKGSEVYFSVFAIEKGGDYAKFGKALVSKGAAMSCRTIG